MKGTWQIGTNISTPHPNNMMRVVLFICVVRLFASHCFGDGSKLPEFTRITQIFLLLAPLLLPKRGNRTNTMTDQFLTLRNPGTMCTNMCTHHQWGLGW